MELPDESKIKLAKLQLEHNRIIWDQLNTGIKQLILYSDSLFPSIKNQTTFKGINFAKLMEPKLHDSFPNRGCSPQGFVAIISPYLLITRLSLFTLSINIIPHYQIGTVAAWRCALIDKFI